MKACKGILGDQVFIEAQVKDAKLWQDEFPKKIVSYKVDCKGGKPKKASIVCFHGLPRPHDIGWKI